MASTRPAPHYVTSLLDTDLYKLTMQQAILHHFPDISVEYKFTNRSKNMKFNQAAVDAITEAIYRLEDVVLQDDELEWLKTECPYFNAGYLAFLKGLRLNPREQVTLQFVPTSEDPTVGDLEIAVKGLWCETILYEVPLMAIVSEAYFLHVDTDWSLEGQEEQAYSKGKTLYEGGVVLAEFGTRRRRSHQTQDIVIQGLLRAHKELSGSSAGKLVGTSNVHFAHKYGLTPIGTIAHEWTMGIGAYQGYEKANIIAMELWEEVYPPDSANALHIALTDTFTSAVFFKDLTESPAIANRWRGVRQDSGDPLAFIPLAKEAYESIGISPKDKLIIFSDGLNTDACLRIRVAADEAGFKSSFGVGTFLTNDFKSTSTGGKSKALNIVIKLHTIGGKQCIKLSDDLTKNTGDQATVSAVKRALGLPGS